MKEKLIIRAMRDKINEKESRYVVIYNPNKQKLEYYDFGAQIYLPHFKNRQLYRGRVKDKIYLEKKMTVIPFDITEMPTIEMYNIFGQLLKANGYIFNKKKGEILTNKGETLF